MAARLAVILPPVWPWQKNLFSSIGSTHLRRSDILQIPRNKLRWRDRLWFVTGVDQGSKVPVVGDDEVGFGGDGSVGESVVIGVAGVEVKVEGRGDTENVFVSLIHQSHDGHHLFGLL